ncbi:MAG: phage protein Gp36 family protein [Elusimicrobiota bacterium]|jgi:phage gp36-like protein
MALYTTRARLLAAISQDSQAKLSTDPSRRWVVGTGDGTTTTFTTPFLEVTTFKVYVDGTLLTASIPTLSRGTGTDSRDRIVFATAPTAGQVVSVSADASAINADVLDAAIVSVSGFMEGYLYAILPVTDTALLASLDDKAIIFVKVRLRGRRNLDVVDPIEMEWKAAVRWLELVAEGKIPISQGTPETTLDGSAGEFVYGSFAQVFSDPDEGTSL